MKNFNILAFSVAILATSFLSFNRAQAAGGGGMGWEINPAAMYLMDTVQDSGSTINTTRLLFEGAVGYKFSSPLYLGAIYFYDNTTASGGSINNKDTFSGYGPQIGIETDNLYMIFSYFFASTYDAVSGSTTTAYTAGNGFQLALGYRFRVGSSMSIGPQLNYRSTKYTKRKTGSGAETSADYTYTTLVPLLAFSFDI